MTLRTIKLLLVFGVAIFYSLVVFDNITDYGSNYEFVRHVMMMDSTFPGNRGMWRAINTPQLHTAFYVSRQFEAERARLHQELSVEREKLAHQALHDPLTGLPNRTLLYDRMAQALRGTPAAFHYAKRVSIVALALSLLMWLVAFLAVGGEWFLMWQSKTSNGQDAAFRMFTVIGIVLLLVAQPDIQDQP